MLVIFWFWGRGHPGTQSPKLSVVFMGITNNPMRQFSPTRIEVCQGATGLCALFWVANITSNKWIWFKTASVEQKTDTGWLQFVPTNRDWAGINGGAWGPRYGCFYAVRWPPGLPTNASWRLQTGYGREPSHLGLVVNQKLGLEVFRSRGQESIVPSSEVKQ
jgi:hypothetical protein